MIHQITSNFSKTVCAHTVFEKFDVKQSTCVSDGQTDAQTDRITMTKTVQRIASHDKNVGKIKP